MSRWKFISRGLFIVCRTELPTLGDPAFSRVIATIGSGDLLKKASKFDERLPTVNVSVARVAKICEAKSAREDRELSSSSIEILNLYIDKLKFLSWYFEN